MNQHLGFPVTTGNPNEHLKPWPEPSVRPSVNDYHPNPRIVTATDETSHRPRSISGSHNTATVIVSGPSVSRHRDG